MASGTNLSVLAGGADLSNRPAPPPAGVIAVGRARDYRQWVKLEQALPVMAFLKKKLVEEEGDALLEDWDLNQPVEFVATFDRNFRRTPDEPAPRAKTETEPEEGEGEGDDAEEATPEPPADAIEDHFFAAFSLPLTRYAPDSSYSKLMALMGGQELGSALIALESLFHGTTIVATKSVKMRGNVAEANASYYLSKEGLAALRQILSFDIEHLLELVKSMNPKEPPSESLPKLK